MHSLVLWLYEAHFIHAWLFPINDFSRLDFMSARYSLSF
ncbi:hypothetical protein HPSA50_1348 [Helicobacter pylori SouthAfrica50]|uniref:Uncharacterized protein n=1 Tax=Helicobacter pylori SouthAfrica50 TaxID=1352357 RepID=T2S8U9_HELPX|nr:hypothetical protein HPSA50_1348 [Helicobacter pylori SouthAfrica50]